MRELESKIEREAVRLVYKHLGITGSKLIVVGSTGYPDRIFWVPGGKPLLIEFKKIGGLVQPKQNYIHTQLRDLGYHVEVHNNALDAFQSVIKAVEASRLSKKGCEVLVRARSVCALLRSRSGED